MLSSPAWLDIHFEACRAEYDAMLHWAALQPGCSVLDAGCGAGSFLPLIRREVGADGRLCALDSAPENVSLAHQRHAVATVVVATVSALPFVADTFDAVWCANVTQFFADDDLEQLLHEFQRVARPGGLVAIKDMDMTAFRVFPAPPFAPLHLAEASVALDPTPQSRGSLRGRELRRWLERAGYEDVRQQSFGIERWSPLDAAPEQLWSEWLPYLARLAEERGVPAEDLVFWRQVITPQLARDFVRHADFYAYEMHVVAVGRVPAKWNT